jgi:hypothetical protein
VRFDRAEEEEVVEEVKIALHNIVVGDTGDGFGIFFVGAEFPQGGFLKSAEVAPAPLGVGGY